MLKSGHRELAIARFLSIAFLIMASLAAAGAIAGVRINTSYSLPLGIYVRTRDVDARLIEFCPLRTFRYGVHRARIPHSWHCLSRRLRAADETDSRCGWGSCCLFN